MKRKIIYLLCTFTILFTCSCTNNKSPNDSKESIETGQVNTNRNEVSITNTSSEQNSSESNDHINPKNYEDLSSLPEVYTYEMAEKNSNVVWTFNEIVNLKLLDSFISNVENEKKDMVRIVCFTKEGDSIISDLVYDGKVIILTNDSTRDEYSSNPSVKKYEFDSIVIENRYNDHYKGTFIEYVLTKESDDSKFMVAQIFQEGKKN